MLIQVRIKFVPFTWRTNHLDSRKLKIQCNSQELPYNNYPVYIGVNLDRMLAYSEHVEKVKGKVSTRNNLKIILRNGPTNRQNNSNGTLLLFSEYCWAVWGKACHVKVNVELLNTCRVVTGNLRPTPLASLCRLAGIAPEDVHSWPSQPIAIILKKKENCWQFF